MLKKENKKNTGFTQSVDFKEVIMSRTKSASFKLTAGFTILETMVAIAVFLIVITMGVGAVLNATVVHNKSQGMRSAIDSLNFAMDDMVKNLRTGYSFHCENVSGSLPTSQPTNVQDCISGGNFISFTSTTPSGGSGGTVSVSYGISGDGKIYKQVNLGGFQPLTDDFLSIDSNSKFIVTGTTVGTVGDENQPYVVIKLKGVMNYRNTTSPFTIQTSVSQRQLDMQ